jgi:dipeptidyl aminopeptidase/acylaminoacyl peptidase
VVGIDGSQPRVLTRSLGSLLYPTWSPDSSRIAFYGHDNRRGSASTDRLWMVDVHKGDLRCLTENFEGHAGDVANGDAHLGPKLYFPRWDDGDRITMQALVEGRAGLYRVAAAGGEVEQINTSGLSVIGFGQRGDVIAFTGETNTRSAEVYVSRSGHRLQRRSRAADDFFRNHRLQTIEHVRFKGAENWDLEGWAIRPLDAQTGSRYPILIYVHGGPHTAYGNGFYHEFQVLAAAGFGVFFVNPRGSSSYGEEFADAVRGHFGEGDYEDIMAAADLAATWDWVDPERMGIVGGSYGGFMTNWVITHTDRFAAACTQRSICNLLSFAGTSDIGPAFSEDEYGALPWTDRELLMQKSPISYVQNCKTPTLILHQEEDHRCPIEQAEQLYTALVALGVPTKLVRFPGEGHELSRSGQPQRRVNRMHHIIDWFGRYLQA